MLAATKSKIERTLRRVVEMLVAQDYAALEALTDGVRLRATEIERCITEYGRTLVLPPDDAYARVEIYPIRERTPPQYAIDFALYTLEEGESDLSLRATVIEVPTAELMKVVLDDILVP